ncbi:F-box protein At2g26850-like [Coffea eugenioides]|uniref:F-box protein At2g26850 n=1 Tax=Coffea arabica TaxID=13443 RepID=A0A6P6TNE6_COFAR|nr:F-box protein At2g26850-like [Coffea arabica]XP_027160187.1 F-box protein At2g26850-like [Coffea eugenioides]
MLFFLITCCSFIIFFYKSLSFKLLPLLACEMRLLSLWCWKDFSLLSLLTKSIKSSRFFASEMMMSFKKRTLQTSSKTVVHHNADELSSPSSSEIMSILDLPELVLECILEKLPPEGLCSMAAVCRSLRDRCMSDHLWEKHMIQKWGRIIGPAAHREWQWHIATRKDSCFNQATPKGSFNYLSQLWPLSLVRSSLRNRITKRKNSPPVDSVMSWYLALESGKLFPAQVYNREHGHVGFMLSCYDAELSYNPRTDTFQARYPPHGNRAVAVETDVTWDRIRAPPVDTPPHDLHISDCLSELHPGDHIEIQWRRNKEFPYGWWYGVVGHLETCDGNSNYCRCHESDSVVLEFNQYTPGSRWRTTTLSRKDHREGGNEADGFYGGIRNLQRNEEISTWKKLWPTEILE